MIKTYLFKTKLLTDQKRTNWRWPARLFFGCIILIHSHATILENQVRTIESISYLALAVNIHNLFHLYLHLLLMKKQIAIIQCQRNKLTAASVSNFGTRIKQYQTVSPLACRGVADVFQGVFVLTGIFIKGGYQIRVPKARASRRVWGHASSGNFEI